MLTSTLPLPSDMSVEFALLGWIISNNDLMDHIGFLEPNHFHSRPHAAIYAAMKALHSQDTPVTPFTIVLDPENLATVREAGGLQRYLAGALSSSTGLHYPVEQAKHLVHLSQKRDFITACQQSSNAASHPSDEKTAEEHAATLSLHIDNILRGGGVPDFQNNFDVIGDILTDLKSDLAPTPVGIPKLDEAMGGGLFPGRSYGFAARKKVGKTILAGTISCNLNAANVKHLFICGEMSPKEIHQRTLARLTDSFPSAFRTEYGKTVAFQRKIAEVALATPRCTFYHNAPGLTFDELRRVASVALQRRGIKGIILDYWQLVGGKTRSQSTAEHLDEVAQWIADFGRKHQIWTITMAQINQEGNTRGGEGLRLAFDQVYQLRAPNDDVTRTDRWLEMMDTRYTAWNNVGSETQPELLLDERGPYFRVA